MTIPADIRDTLVALLEAAIANAPIRIPPGHAERIDALLVEEFPGIYLMRGDDGFYILGEPPLREGGSSMPLLSGAVWMSLRRAVRPRAFSPATLAGWRARQGPKMKPDRLKNVNPVKP